MYLLPASVHSMWMYTIGLSSKNSKLELTLSTKTTFYCDAEKNFYVQTLKSYLWQFYVYNLLKVEAGTLSGFM